VDKVRPQAQDADQYQVDCYYEVQDSWDQQDQNSGNQCDERLDGHNVDSHDDGSDFVEKANDPIVASCCPTALDE
jgi:hypothetical protein